MLFRRCVLRVACCALCLVLSLSVACRRPLFVVRCSLLRVVHCMLLLVVCFCWLFLLCVMCCLLLFVVFGVVRCAWFVVGCGLVGWLVFVVVVSLVVVC